MSDNDVVIDGEQARELCRTLLIALEPLIPGNVEVRVGGKRRYTRLTGSRSEPLTRSLPQDHALAQAAIKKTPQARRPAPTEPVVIHFLGGHRSAIPFFGRSPFPLFDRMTAAEHAEAAMTDALRRLQQLVASQVFSDWPAPGAVVASSSDETHVDLWFECGGTTREQVGRFPIDLAIKPRRRTRRWTATPR